MLEPTMKVAAYAIAFVEKASAVPARVTRRVRVHEHQDRAEQEQKAHCGGRDSASSARETDSQTGSQMREDAADEHAALDVRGRRDAQ